MTSALITAKWARSRLRIPATLTTVTKSETRDVMNHPLEVRTSKSTRCYLEGLSSAEVTAGRIVGTVTFRAWLPSCDEVDGASELMVLGAVYQVDGPPRPLIHPYTRERVAWELDLIRAA